MARRQDNVRPTVRRGDIREVRPQYRRGNIRDVNVTFFKLGAAKFHHWNEAKTITG